MDIPTYRGTTGAERSLVVNGETVTLDELGPIILQEDGRLGRLSNWHDMTEPEQAATLRSSLPSESPSEGRLCSRRRQGTRDSIGAGCSPAVYSYPRRRGKRGDGVRVVQTSTYYVQNST